ncbi:LCP family protein [Anabaena sp. FACHB-1237]|nr:LCP family protein [Anabaena sp. FACHB-1237]MBD2136713.1 LCP family protein [Anabaena sp. FACHB-1237]
MIKPVPLSDNPMTNQPVETELDVIQDTTSEKPLQAHKVYRPVKSGKTQPPVKKQLNNAGSVVESVGSIPDELYKRLGLSMPQWLLWLLTIVLGIIISGLIASILALWTPLWSNLDQPKDEDFTANNKDQPKLTSDVWTKFSQYKLSKPMNILVMGIEPVKGAVDGSLESFSGSSDTMMLVRVNPSDKSIRLLSIPRGTMIAIPEQGLNKVSEANAKGGPVLAARVVSRSLSNAPIDRYIRISTGSFRQLVNLLGGVDVFVPQAMNYQDTSSGFNMNLVSGWQTLNGEQAEAFARYTEGFMGDLPRVQRQQTLITALMQRLSNPSVLNRLPQLTRIMRKYFDTNLKTEEIMALANFSLTVEREKFQMAMLPGTFSKFSQDPNSYWLNLTGQQSLLNDYAGVNVPSLQEDVRPVLIRKVAIQNGTNRPELTEKVIAYLKEKGFTNVYAVAPWSDNQRQTQIIVQKGTREIGQEMQKVLGLGQVELSTTGDLESEITIRIGKDWQ